MPWRLESTEKNHVYFYTASKTSAVLNKYILNDYLLIRIVEYWLHCWVTTCHRLSMDTKFTHSTMKSMEWWDDLKQGFHEIFIAFHKCKFIPLGKASHILFYQSRMRLLRFPWVYGYWEKHSNRYSSPVKFYFTIP